MISFSLVPCETSSYKIETTGYDTDSVITIPMHKAWKRSALPDLAAPPNITTYSLMITFPRTDIDFSEEVQLNQISDFISSVGGNLGLFISDFHFFRCCYN